MPLLGKDNAMRATQEVYGQVNPRNPNFSDVAVELKKTRIIYKCSYKKCKHVWAHEYRKVFRQMEERITPRNGFPIRIPTQFDFYRYVDGEIRREDEERKCPKCGLGRGTPNIVVGVVNSKHTCDARCMSAKSGDCECSCGGENHGIAHV